MTDKKHPNENKENVEINEEIDLGQEDLGEGLNVLFISLSSVNGAPHVNIAVTVSNNEVEKVADMPLEELFEYALKNEDFSPCQTLLNAKLVDINKKDKEGNTLLHNISTPEQAAFLLQNGADITAKNNKGETPVEHHQNNNEVITAMSPYLTPNVSRQLNNCATPVTSQPQEDNKTQSNIYDNLGR